MKSIKKTICTILGSALAYNKQTKQVEEIKYTTIDTSKEKTIDEKVAELLPDNLKLVEVLTEVKTKKTYTMSVSKFIDCAEENETEEEN